MRSSALFRCCFGRVIAALMLGLSSALVAAPITAQVTPLSPRARSSAPQPLEVRLHVQGTGLLEGVLEITTGEEGYRYRTQELALSAGTRSMRLLLPAMPNNFSDEPALRLRFLTKERPIDLGNFSFGRFMQSSGNVTICVSRPETAALQGSETWPQLRFDSSPPGQPANNQSGWMSIITTPIHLPTEELPADPLAYCSYDLVLLENAGLAGLRSKQLTAIESWVRAGGSLCVIPGSGLKAEHVDFLNRLSPEQNGMAFTLGEGGRLAGEPARRLVHSGLGRMALLPATGSGAPEWNEVSGFLWKKRIPVGFSSTRDSTYHGWIMEALMPKTVQLIPHSTLLLVAIGFILAIGPADYFLLGKLRRRRLTWIVFPLVAVAFTWLTIWLAGRALGSNSQQSSLIITDLAPDGKVVRETRIAFAFAAGVQEAVLEARNALLAPMHHQSGRQPSDEGENGAVVEGQFPAHYRYRRTLRQWTPELNRLTSIEPKEDSSGVPWEEVARLLEPASPEEDTVFLNQWQNGGTFWDIAAFSNRASNDKRSRKNVQAPPILAYGHIRDFSISPTHGIFSRITQISPNGARSLDDLVMIAEKGPYKVLTATRREGDDIHLFRRLYPSSEKGAGASQAAR